MGKRVLPFSLPAILALAMLAGATSAVAAPSAGETADGRLIVGFKPGIGAAQRRAALADRGEVVRELGTGRAVLVEPPSPVGEVRALAAIAASDAVAYVEPNYRVHAERSPNDPLFGRQWHLENLGQTDGTPGADIAATAAWDRFIGGEVIVAVLDTGADVNHPDLKPNLWVNPNETANGRDDDADPWGFVDDVHGADFSVAAHDPANCSGGTTPKPRDGSPEDLSGHGTHLAGIVAAAGDNGIGVSGVSWSGVKVMPVKFLDGCGDGTTADAVDAVAYARRHGARIVNASFGGAERSQALDDAIRGEDFLFVSAAGNGGADAVGDNIDLPGTPITPDFDEFPAESNLANILTVAATTDRDELATYSNYGPGSVDIAAPGSAITSTMPGGQYGVQSGTSMATAVASGAAALVAAGHPGIGVLALRSALLDSADDVGSLALRVAGNRRLNVDRALGEPAVRNSSPTGLPNQTQSQAAAPARFRLLAPRNGARRRSARVTFRWRASRSTVGIRDYRLYVNGRRKALRRDPDGQAGRRRARTSAVFSLRRGRTYRWYVKAFDHNGRGVRSPAAKRTYRFTIPRRR